MARLHHPIAVLLLVLSAVFPGRPAADPAAPALKVAIAVTSAADVSGRPEVAAGSAVLQVVVKNVSSRPLRLWDDRCTPGHDALTLSVDDGRGHAFVLHRPPLQVEKYVLKSVVLEPGDTLVYEETLGQETWHGWALPAGQAVTVSVQAVLAGSPGALARQYAVWTGRAVSAPRTFRFLAP